MGGGGEGGKVREAIQGGTREGERSTGRALGAGLPGGKSDPVRRGSFFLTGCGPRHCPKRATLSGGDRPEGVRGGEAPSPFRPGTQGRRAAGYTLIVACSLTSFHQDAFVSRATIGSPAASGAGIGAGGGGQRGAVTRRAAAGVRGASRPWPRTRSPPWPMLGPRPAPRPAPPSLPHSLPLALFSPPVSFPIVIKL